MKNVLIIFIRNPVLGKVKTRLAHILGTETALDIYQILLEKTRAAATGVAAARHLFYSDYIPEHDDWPAEAFEKKLQPAGDLGARMEAAFQDAFESGAGKALIIGSDCPELNPGTIQTAFEKLDDADFVVGPVPDGGYYLLGMKQMAPDLFRGIAWSTATVRAATIQRMEAMGKTHALLPVLTDIDEAGDWVAYLKRS